jgi:hypothetical protein
VCVGAGIEMAIKLRPLLVTTTSLPTSFADLGDSDVFVSAVWIGETELNL